MFGLGIDTRFFFIHAATIVLVWLVVRFLPKILELVKLKQSVSDNTLTLISAALISYALIVAIIMPLAGLLFYFPISL